MLIFGWGFSLHDSFSLSKIICGVHHDLSRQPPCLQIVVCCYFKNNSDFSPDVHSSWCKKHFCPAFCEEASSLRALWVISFLLSLTHCGYSRLHHAGKSKVVLALSQSQCSGHLITQQKACGFTPLNHYNKSHTVKCRHMRFSK